MSRPLLLLLTLALVSGCASTTPAARSVPCALLVAVAEPALDQVESPIPVSPLVAWLRRILCPTPRGDQ